MALQEINWNPYAMGILIATLGLIFGSFSSVLALRIPVGKSVVTPPSACPQCHRILPPWENFPLVSYLVLRGRCKGCHQPIGSFYPMMEIGTATIYVIAIYVGGITPLGLAYTGFAVITLPLVVIDLKYKRLPNVLTYSGLTWGLLAAVISAALNSDLNFFLTPLLTGIGCAGFFLLLNLISRGGMGMGDVKLAAVIGVTLGIAGWQLATFAILLSFLIGGLLSIALLATDKAKFGSSIPFGPSMLLGAWIAVLLGSDLARQVIQLWALP